MGSRNWFSKIGAALKEDDCCATPQSKAFSRNLAIADFLKSIACRHGVSTGVIAIAWTLHHPAITAAIVGGRNPKQVEGVVLAINFRLTEAEFSEITTFLDANL